MKSKETVKEIEAKFREMHQRINSLTLKYDFRTDHSPDAKPEVVSNWLLILSLEGVL